MKNEVIKKLSSAFSEKPYVSSAVLGFLIGHLAIRAFIVTVNPGALPDLLVTPLFPFLLNWMPIVCVILLSYLLKKKFPSLWKDAKKRSYSSISTLIGYSLGWYAIAFTGIELFPFALMGIMFFASLIISFSVNFFGGLSLLINSLSTIAIIALSLYLTRGLNWKKRSLITLLMFLLVFWPSGGAIGLMAM